MANSILRYIHQAIFQFQYIKTLNLSYLFLQQQQKKLWITKKKKSMYFQGPIRGQKLEGELPPWNLEKYVNVERHNDKDHFPCMRKKSIEA
jgi:hypothetical protein